MLQSKFSKLHILLGVWASHSFTQQRPPQLNNHTITQTLQFNQASGLLFEPCSHTHSQHNILHHLPACQCTPFPSKALKHTAIHLPAPQSMANSGVPQTRLVHCSKLFCSSLLLQLPLISQCWCHCAIDSSPTSGLLFAPSFLTCHQHTNTPTHQPPCHL